MVIVHAIDYAYIRLVWKSELQGKSIVQDAESRQQSRVHHESGEALLYMLPIFVTSGMPCGCGHCLV